MNHWGFTRRYSQDWRTRSCLERYIKLLFPLALHSFNKYLLSYCPGVGAPALKKTGMVPPFWNLQWRGDSQLLCSDHCYVSGKIHVCPSNQMRVDGMHLVESNSLWRGSFYTHKPVYFVLSWQSICLFLLLFLLFFNSGPRYEILN